MSATRDPLQGGALLLAYTTGYVAPLLAAASVTVSGWVVAGWASVHDKAHAKGTGLVQWKDGARQVRCLLAAGYLSNG